MRVHVTIHRNYHLTQSITYYYNSLLPKHDSLNHIRRSFRTDRFVTMRRKYDSTESTTYYFNAVLPYYNRYNYNEVYKNYRTCTKKHRSQARTLCLMDRG